MVGSPLQIYNYLQEFIWTTGNTRIYIANSQWYFAEQLLFGKIKIQRNEYCSREFNDACSEKDSEIATLKSW